MSKTGIISSHISKCEQLYASNELNEIKDFIEEMISVYNKEIDGFTNNLNSRSIIRAYEGIRLDEAKKDLNRIKAILENYKANIKCGLFQSSVGTGINIKNIATSEAKVNINLTFEQVIKNIQELPYSTISKDEKEDVEDKLRALEAAVNNGDKDKIETKIKRLISFALEKGPAVITLVSSAISLLQDKILPLF